MALNETPGRLRPPLARPHQILVLAVLAWLPGLVVPVRISAQSLPSGPVEGDDENTPSELVSFNIRDLELLQVLESLIYQRDLNIIAPPGLDQRVTLRLTNVPWKRALSLVLQIHGYGYEIVDNIIRIDTIQNLAQTRYTREYEIRWLDVSDLRNLLDSVVQDPSEFRVLPAPRSGGDAYTFRVVMTALRTEQARVQELLIEYDRPPDRQQILVEGPFADGTLNLDLADAPVADTVEDLRRRFQLNVVWEDRPTGRTTVRLNRVDLRNALRVLLDSVGFGFELDGRLIRIGRLGIFSPRLVTRLYTLRYANAFHVLSLVQSRLSPSGRVEIFGGTAAVAGTGPALPVVAGVAADGTPIAAPGAAAGAAAPAPAAAPPGAPPQPVASAFGTGGTRQGGAQTLAPQPPSNVLILTDVPRNLDLVEDLIREADRPPRQISIAVKIVEVTRSSDVDLGIEWQTLLRASGATGQTIKFPFERVDFTEAGVQDAFTLGTLSAADFNLVLRALSTKNQLRVLSSPNVSTLSHQAATIHIGQRFPITVETVEAQTLRRTVTLDRFEEIGIQLTVTPRVAGDDHINLTIAPEVSSLGQLIENRFPVINTRKASTQLLIKDGDTAVIGGLAEDRNEGTERGLPGLAHLPIIGRFFGSNRNQKSKSELLIFVTPKIRDPSGESDPGPAFRQIEPVPGTTDPDKEGNHRPRHDLRTGPLMDPGQGLSGSGVVGLDAAASVPGDPPDESFPPLDDTGLVASFEFDHSDPDPDPPPEPRPARGPLPGAGPPAPPWEPEDPWAVPPRSRPRAGSF